MDEPVTEREWIRQALHDLSQPLTALECRLYLGSMPNESDREHDLRETIRDALTECHRLMDGVRSMQDRLHESIDS